MVTAAPLKVVIADDHVLFRQGLRAMLGKLYPDVSVIAEVERVSQVAPALTGTPCDILLLDLQMEDRSALNDIRGLSQLVRVVVLTASQRPEEAFAALHAGARAVVFKRFAVETLMEAMHAVMAGHVWMPPALQSEMTAQMLTPTQRALTSREREIVRLAALGLHNPEIARRLSISEITVKSHLNNVFHKLDIRDRVALTLHAIRVGLVGIDEKLE